LYYYDSLNTILDSKTIIHNLACLKVRYTVHVNPLIAYRTVSVDTRKHTKHYTRLIVGSFTSGL